MVKLLTGQIIPAWINRIASVLVKFPMIVNQIPQEYVMPAALQRKIKQELEKSKKLCKENERSRSKKVIFSGKGEKKSTPAAVKSHCLKTPLPPDDSKPDKSGRVSKTAESSKKKEIRIKIIKSKCKEYREKSQKLIEENKNAEKELEQYIESIPFDPSTHLRSIETFLHRREEDEDRMRRMRTEENEHLDAGKKDEKTQSSSRRIRIMKNKQKINKYGQVGHKRFLLSDSNNKNILIATKTYNVSLKKVNSKKIKSDPIIDELDIGNLHKSRASIGGSAKEIVLSKDSLETQNSNTESNQNQISMLPITGAETNVRKDPPEEEVNMKKEEQIEEMGKPITEVLSEKTEER